MKKTVVLGFFSNRDLLKDLDGEREFIFFDKQSDAFRFHLDNPEIDSYIIEAESFSGEQIENITENIHYLNKMITILIIGCSGKFTNLTLNKNISCVNDNEEIKSHFKTIEFSGRKFNRVEWPLQVSYHEEYNSKERVEGLVISLSVGGCLIRVDSSGMEPKNAKLILTFKFKEFNFLVEGLVIRNKKDEIAVKFNNITPITASYLKEIIDNEILSELKDLDR